VRKPIEWLADTLQILRKFPQSVVRDIGRALAVAQGDEKHPAAKPLKGFSGAGVLEIIENHDGKTYRAVYTVRFLGVVYVLHVFQKKSKRGIATPKKELDLVRMRLRSAREHFEERRRRG